jgi:hypothetical protein
LERQAKLQIVRRSSLKLNATSAASQQAQVIQSLTRGLLLSNLRMSRPDGVGLRFLLYVPAVSLQNRSNALMVR